MRRDEPELFEKAVLLERTLNERRDEMECQGSGEAPVIDHGRMVCPKCSLPQELVAGEMLEHAKCHVHLTRYGKPLEEVIEEAQTLTIFGDDGPESCDEGYCWT